MITKTTYALVGAFVLFFGAIFVWGVLWISSGGAPQAFDRYTVYMTESVSGLNVDSRVTYRGVDVGKVEAIDIDSGSPEQTRLLIQVREGIPITTDTVATLEFQGVTGIAHIDLRGAVTGFRPLMPKAGEEYAVISSQPSLFSRLGTGGSDLLANLVQTSANLNAFLTDENLARASRSIANVAEITDNIARQSAELDRLVADLGATLESTRSAGAAIPDLIARFSRSADAVTRAADEVRVLGERLEAVSAGIEHTVKSSGSDVRQFTGHTLPEISAMVAELRQAAEHLHRLSENLAQDPSTLVYGRPPPSPGPGEE